MTRKIVVAAVAVLWMGSVSAQVDPAEQFHSAMMDLADAVEAREMADAEIQAGVIRHQAGRARDNGDMSVRELNEQGQRLLENSQRLDELREQRDEAEDDARRIRARLRSLVERHDLRLDMTWPEWMDES